MSIPRLVWHQLGLEQRAFWRNPQAAFFTFALPIGLVVIFGAISRDEAVPGRPGVNALSLLVPGFLAFGIIIAAYGNLAATIATLRHDGVLKRLRATPLQPAVYLTGHLANVLTVCAAITITTVAVGFALFGVAPTRVGALLLPVAVATGIVCFAALGLAMSTAIPTADAAGPITNGTYVPLAIVSGTFSSDLVLPDWLDVVVSALPVKALTDILRSSYDATSSGPDIGSLLVLGVWAAIGITLAHHDFRWEPH